MERVGLTMEKTDLRTVLTVGPLNLYSSSTRVRLGRYRFVSLPFSNITRFLHLTLLDQGYQGESMSALAGMRCIFVISLQEHYYRLGITVFSQNIQPTETGSQMCGVLFAEE